VTASPHQPLFLRPEFQAIAGATLRPGGLALTERALALLDLQAGARVLDVGCGLGATARLLATRGCAVLALDSSPRLLGRAECAKATRLLGRAQMLPVRSACLDAVFCECVLSVADQSNAVLAEIARVLQPGGWLALSDLYLRGGAAAQDSAPGQGHDCLSGAQPEADLRLALSKARLVPEVFEDHSRLLAQLAGELIFAGLPAQGLMPCAPCGGEGRGVKPGYFLCLARKHCQ